MDGQSTDLFDRAKQIAERMMADVEKLGHEGLSEIEKLLGMQQNPAPAAPAVAAEPVPPAAAAPAPQPQTPQG